MADPHFANVSLLAHFDGPDGSTSFVDSSSNALALTAAGNAQTDTAQAKFGGASCLLDGDGDYVSVPGSALFDYGSGYGAGDFTIEAWIRPASLSSMFPVYSQGDRGNGGEFSLYVTDYGSLVFEEAFYKVSESDAGMVSAGSWHHVAVVRSGGRLALYVDGVNPYGSAPYGSGLSSTATNRIGYSTLWGSDSFANGHIDELRITKGVGRYTAEFSPPTEPFPNTAPAIPSDVRVSVTSPLGLPAPEITIRPPVDARTLIASPLGDLAALIEMPETAQMRIPSPVGAVRTYVLNDFTALISDPTERYIMRITGDPPAEVPISSWQATVQDDRASFLQCVVPAVGDYADVITARQGVEQMVIYRQTAIGGQTVESEMARADLSTVIVNRGPTKETGTLSGYADAFSSPVSASTVQLQGVRSSSQTIGGSARVRASIDWLLRPGQVVTDGTISFTAGYINYFVPTVGDAYMDVGSRG